MDVASAEFLLARLERENQALALNPKTILVQDGALRADQSTLKEIALTSTTYSTKAPTENGEASDGTDVDFWSSIVSDYASTLHKIPHLLTAKVRAGIPPHLRSQIWSTMSGAQTERFASLYPLLLNEDSPFDRIIKRDIPRTFPKLSMFKDEGGEGQMKLYRLLKGYSIYDADVGYCQGLSFVVGPLLLQDMSEVEAFAVFVRLMEDAPPPKKANSNVPHHPHRSYALRTLFTPQMTGLHLMLYQLTELVRLHLPALFAHFADHGVTSTMYASQWFLTLFTYNFPLPLVFRIFDIIFAEGAAETMLRFSLAILRRNEERLLMEPDFDGVLLLLKGQELYAVYADDPERVVKDAMGVHDWVSEAGLAEMRVG
ncbi:rab-GTPase-TBC domain-containing protein [Blyttiomyces helicus]|uniref:Rab-GTPase-TBC domain-containing protein n=1 Tax=Blyttiomyces helicus TaxID=388810 RepID=A0A4V1IS28_9FUNG|nr:rab-GTPase-TBC domain-containing protein [Blyttiomyces helicus]|eukprot:RKO92107.1 rab-GTPase-TBC domain-containing protein [Blyttiomyces helicus]